MTSSNWLNRMDTTRTLPAGDRESGIAAGTVSQRGLDRAPSDARRNGRVLNNSAPAENIGTASKTEGRWGSDTAGKRDHCRTSRTWQPIDPLCPEKFSTQEKRAVLPRKSRPPLRECCPAFHRIDPGSPPFAQTKKTPDHSSMIRGCPGLSTYRHRPPDPRGEAVTFQAGILTPGSSSHRVFPTWGQ